MSSFADSFSNIAEGIAQIPIKVKEFLVDVFVPDAADIESELTTFLNELKRQFQFNTDQFVALFTNETSIADKDAAYTLHGVGTFNLKFLDTSFLIQGINYFRPFIRGFLVLLMLIYHVRMIMGFIRQDAGAVAGTVGSSKED